MFEIRDRKFYKDGKETPIYSGSIHYFRSFPEKWRDLMIKLKQCGLNTVETYAAWNVHEKKRGEFDFSGNADIVKFLEIAQELGLYVILRPGPYICAEWEFGGFPGWLLEDESIRIRSMDENYMFYVKRFIHELMKRVTPFLESRGGNIIMMAAENEYGSYGNSRTYMNACAQMLIDEGVDVPLVTADGHTDFYLNGGMSDLCMPTIDFGFEGMNDSFFEPLLRTAPDAAPMHMEHWIGNFAHWGEALPQYPAKTVAEEVQGHLDRGYNFNFYMFHGGTNFGFYNGANGFTHDAEDRMHSIYYPDETSYDYDAPLSEWGECTEKYFAIQKVMAEHLGFEPEIPEKVKTQSLGKVELKESASLFDNLDNISKKHTDIFARNMEHYGQSYGYIYYKTKILGCPSVDMLGFRDVNDRFHVFIDGEHIATFDRNSEKPYILSDTLFKKDSTLEILCENQGRINYGPDMLKGERKGICDSVYIAPGHSRQILCEWEIYPLPMDNLQSLCYNGEKKLPAFFRGSFKADKKEDCFIDMTNFKKGFVTVNGFTLGRYWEVGPHLSLYLPGGLLKDENEIIVFEEEGFGELSVEIIDHPITNNTSAAPELIE